MYYYRPLKGPNIKEKIILHLSRYPHSKYVDTVVPRALTQEGISEAVGSSRNYISVALGRMEQRDKPFIFSEVRRVKKDKKRKVYFLTKYGMQQSKRIIDRYTNAGVRIILDEKEAITIPLSELGNYVSSKEPVIEGLIKMDNFGNIHIQSELQSSVINTLYEREEYLQKFEDLLGKVKTSGMRCVLISGGAGVGKSSLAIQFTKLAARVGFVTFESRCYANMNVPYFPVISMLKATSQILGAHKRILKELQSYKEPATSGEILDSKRKELWFKLAEDIARESSKKPLLIYLDDIQWADLSTISLIDYLCDILEDAPVIFMFTQLNISNSKNAQSFTHLNFINEKRERLLDLKLKPLSLTATKKLIFELVKAHISERYIKEIWEITGGNPLFIKEVAQKMILTKEKLPEEDEFNISIPSKIEALVLNKLINLSPKAITTIKIASVFGQIIPIDILEMVVGMELSDALTELVDVGLLTNYTSSSYSFAHPIIQRIIYSKVNHRKEIHKNIVKAAKSLHLQDNYDYFNLGVHYEKSGAFGDAVEYYLRLSKLAMQSYAYEDAILFVEKSLKLAKKSNMDYKGILEKLANLYILRGRYHDAISIYKELLSRFEGYAQASYYLKMAQVYREMGNFRDSLKYVQMGLEQEQNATMIRVNLLSEHIWLSLKMGCIDTGLKSLDELKKITANMHAETAIAIYYENEATIAHYTGEIERAMSSLEAAIRIRERHNDTMHLATLYTNLGILWAQKGDLDRAIEYFFKSRDIDTKLGNLRGLSQTYTDIGIAYHKRGTLKDAINFLKKAQEIYKKIGSKDSLAISHLNIGNVLIDMGEFETAIHEIEISNSMFEKMEDSWGLCHAERALGEAHIYTGDYPLALFWISRGIMVAKGSENKECLLESYIDLARLYIKIEEYEFASEIINKIERIHNKKGDYILGQVLLLKGELSYLKGMLPTAAESFKLALELLEKNKETVLAYIAKCILGLTLQELGVVKSGLRLLNESKDYFNKEKIQYWSKICNSKKPEPW